MDTPPYRRVTETRPLIVIALIIAGLLIVALFLILRSRQAGAPARALRLSAETVDFGARPLDTPSAVETVSIANDSDEAIALGDLLLAGDAAGDFLIVEDDCSGVTLPAGGRCTVDLVFNPQAQGGRRAELHAPVLDGTVRVVLSGTGVAATSDAEGGVVAVTPGSVAFGEQVVGEASGALPVTLRNQGTGPIQLDVRIETSTPGEFTVGTDRCSNVVLSPGDDCVVEVVFGPGATGLRSAQLILRDINANTTQSVALTGSGVDAAAVPAAVSLADPVEVEGTAAAVVGLRPERVEFGAQTVASSSRRQDVTIVNEGSEAIRITSVALDGGAPADFVLAADRCSDAVLPPAGRCAVVVVFQPRATGVRSARLVVANDGGGAARTALLSGTGT